MELFFRQVCIFVKSVSRAKELDRLLRECNFPSIAIHSGLDQAERYVEFSKAASGDDLTSRLRRISRYKSFKAFEKRILVATDIFGRGIDVERVNVVINYVSDSLNKVIPLMLNKCTGRSLRCRLVLAPSWSSWSIWYQGFG